MAKPKKPARANNDEAQAPIEASPAAEPKEEEAQAPSEPSPAVETVSDATEPASEGAGGAEADVWAQDRVAADALASPEVEASAGDQGVWAESAEGGDALEGGAEEAAPGDETADEAPVVLDSSQMESIIESLLFASDKVLGLAEIKRLLGERDGKKVTAAVEALLERRRGSGIEVVRLANGWHMRTNPEHARWVSKLLAGRPMRLSRAMMETLAIVAYRQPVTRPEVDEIRGVDCGPVLKTLLDRGLVRIIGKKEEVGRPLLYGTTPEFLRVFSLGELSELPTLREYAELSSEQQERVDAEHGAEPEAEAVAAAGAGAGPAEGVAPTVYNLNFVARSQLPEEPEETDPLLDELDSASKVASKILGAVSEPAAEEEATEPEATPVPPPGEPTSGS
ncbi:MAG TPA: SMC-Scp complex subunit ScpB [Polyangia bacterium]|jgi:segregation and condensation protein B|nr:SMC-Scp complex subunit ScpB [Polyangia bacterium]